MKSSFILTLSFATLAPLFAQQPELRPNRIMETTACENGSVGLLTFYDLGSVYAATFGLMRVDNCNSTNSKEVVAKNACSVLPAALALQPAHTSATPSDTLPSVQSLDAGESAVLEGPSGAVELRREITGPGTSYGFSVTRTPLLTAPPPSQFPTGHYELRMPGGRDLGAFQAGFDVTFLDLTRPAAPRDALGTMHGAEPPSIAWTGGSRLNDVSVDIAVSPRVSTLPKWNISCRVADGASTESFRVPADVWNTIPAEVRDGGTASIVVTALGHHVSLDVPGLDHGVRVQTLNYSSRVYRLIP